MERRDFLNFDEDHEYGEYFYVSSLPTSHETRDEVLDKARLVIPETHMHKVRLVEHQRLAIGWKYSPNYRGEDHWKPGRPIS